MIFYFSGTGNTRWAAIQIGAATQERLINIADYSDYLSADKAIEPFALKEGERLGFVFPVHGWRVPKLVRSFISQLRLKPFGDGIFPDSKPFCYAVCTAGDSIGKTIDTLNKSLQANHQLQAMGISQPDSAYSLIMPESYVGLPFMDVDPSEKEKRKKEKAAQQLKAICEDLRERKTGISHLTEGPLPWLFTHIVGGFFEHVLITDKRFHIVEERCVKCGICANVCPVGDISGGKGKSRYGSTTTTVSPVSLAIIIVHTMPSSLADRLRRKDNIIINRCNCLSPTKT